MKQISFPFGIKKIPNLSTCYFSYDEEDETRFLIGRWQDESFEQNNKDYLSLEDYLKNPNKDIPFILWGPKEHSTFLALNPHSTGPIYCLNPALERRKDTAFVVKTTSNCNLSCFGCSRTVGTENNNWVNGNMGLQTFEKIIHNLPDKCNLSLHGVGDPFLTPDYVQFIKLASNLGRFGRIHSTTNGITRSPDYIETLFDNGLSGLSISVDTLDQTLADEIRKGSNIDKPLKTLRTSIRHTKKITISINVSSKNVDDLERTLQMLSDIGEFNVTLQPFQNVGNPSGVLNCSQRVQVEGIYRRITDTCENLTIQYGNSFKENYSVNYPICSAPWTVAGINYNGFLTPCCCAWDSDHAGYSDLKKHSYREIWESTSFQKFLTNYYIEEPAYCWGCEANWRKINNVKNGIATNRGRRAFAESQLSEVPLN